VNPQVEPKAEKASEVGEDIPIEMVMQKDVTTISPDHRASYAAEIMERHKYGCLPVVKDGKLVGIVTETDFVRCARLLLEMLDEKEATASS